MSKPGFLEKLLDGAGVEWRALGEVCEIYGGLTGKSKADFEDGNASYISYKNIFENIDVDFEKLESVNVSSSEKQHTVKYGDVLFTGSSENAEEVGMSSAVTTRCENYVYLNSFSFGVRFNEDICLTPEFSKYLFRSHSIRKQIVKTANGVTRFNISKVQFKKLLIPILCPENPEKSLRIQGEIVRILDKFTGLKVELTAQLGAELTARKKQYEYYRNKLLTFDDVEWKALGDRHFFEVLDRERKPIKADLRTPGATPYYGANNIQDYVNGYTHDGEYVLIAEDGSASLENYSIQYTTGKFWANNHVHVVCGKSIVNTRFLYHYLGIVNFIPFLTGVGRPKLTRKKMVEIPIPIPFPDNQEKSLAEQARIVSILDKFDMLLNSISKGLPREIELRQKQYEYYRNLLLDFPRPDGGA